MCCGGVDCFKVVGVVAVGWREEEKRETWCCGGGNWFGVVGEVAMDWREGEEKETQCYGGGNWFGVVGLVTWREREETKNNWIREREKKVIVFNLVVKNKSIDIG